MTKLHHQPHHLTCLDHQNAVIGTHYLNILLVSSPPLSLSSSSSAGIQNPSPYFEAITLYIYTYIFIGSVVSAMATSFGTTTPSSAPVVDNARKSTSYLPLYHRLFFCRSHSKVPKLCFSSQVNNRSLFWIFVYY